MESMIYNVAQLMKAPVGTSLVNDFHEDDIQLDDDINVVSPLDAQHEVDLTAAIRQVVLTALPMVTLCREDCRGLCSQCGHDLNLGPCECKPEVDARLSVLEKLLQNGSQS